LGDRLTVGLRTLDP